MFLRSLGPILLAIASVPVAFAATGKTTTTATATATTFLITNDDLSGTRPNTATFFTIAADGTLSNPTAISVGGHGNGGGFFAANRVNVLNNPTSPCAYFSAGSSDVIASVQLLTQTAAGTFSASATDIGADNGIGMAMNNNYLYASFSTSGTIATFAVEPGCGLQFLSDISPAGLNGGVTKGMALYGNLLVVTYGDGSIQSFNISGGVPVPNDDEQNATGFASDDFPDGVTITADGQYAIFGDASSGAAVEVSDISSGQLTPTVFYSLDWWTGFNSNNVALSPDGTLLYITNSSSGQVTAAFFDQTTGEVSQGCTSAQLNGFDSAFTWVSSPVTQLSTGTGSVLYVAEFGGPSAIAVLNVSSNAGQCTLTEAATSPVSDPNSQNLVSIAVVQLAQPGVYSPAPGSTLTASSATFEWYGFSGATAYWVDIGSTAGGNNYYSSGNLGLVYSTSTSNLPTNGSTIYVTLYAYINGSWSPNAYTYTAFNAGSATAVLTTPPPSSTLSGSSVTFGWNAGTASPQEYWLDIGSSAGGNNYYSSGNLESATSATVSGLPTNGTTVYVTLYTLVSGTWTPNSYTYTAFSQSSAQGVITTPTPGSTLTSSTVTFDWTAGSPGPYSYWLDVGSSAGANNYYSSGNLGNVTTTTASGLPTNGSTVYVTLYTLISGSWVSNAYTYTALNPSGGLAAMQSPTPGSTLSGTTATFTWSSDSSATAYWVDIGSAAGGNDVYSSGNLGTALTTTVDSLPANGSTVYVTLYSYVGGQWLSNSYTYVSGT
jgi:6-phosphogluconolactonase (cycloisomerase 2 family)